MNRWKEILLQPNEPISKAIRVLGIYSLRIVLVVDKNNKLLGTLTDGDIRRGLIVNMGLETPVGEIMCTSPLVGRKDEDKSRLLSLMRTKDVLHIPLTDENGVVVGIETLQRLTETQKYENLVFLMAGGFGKRLQPLTLETPKPLLKVGNKPILENIIRQFITAGFHNFVISTHYKADMVRGHFGDGSQFGVNIEYVYEDSPRGTAGALGLLSEEMASSLPMLVMNGDLLTKVDFEEVLKFHKEEGGVATMCVREYEFRVPYGVVEIKDNRLTKIIEKPLHKYFINAGIYVLDMQLIEVVKHTKYLDMPDFLQSIVKKGEKVNVFPIHEFWLDIGRMEDFERAQTEANQLFV